MLTLPNGCRCSEPTISPRNWNKPNASIKKDWWIQYYFYEADKNKGVLKITKGGINRLKSLRERRHEAQLFLNGIRKALLEGYNPIKGIYISEPNTSEITENSKLPEGLEYAFNELSVGKQTKENVRCALKRLKKIISDLHYQNFMLFEIKTKHVRRILNKCANDYNFSPQSYNHYRSYLIMLFKILLGIDAVEYNPACNIEKQKMLKKLKSVLTHEEREIINNHFKQTDIYYYRFMHCFFHSGARPIELLEIKKEDVDLANNYYKIIVKKGNLFEEQIRPIKEIALPYWQEQLNETNDGEYVFGSCLKPGKEKGKRGSITQKWQRHVKVKLGIKKDFYSLKHLNLDETAALLDANDASKMAGHTSTVITMQHYLVGEKNRQNERLKKVNNAFA